MSEKIDVAKLVERLRQCARQKASLLTYGRQRVPPDETDEWEAADALVALSEDRERAVLEEREACAVLCETWAAEERKPTHLPKAIRARGSR